MSNSEIYISAYGIHFNLIFGFKFRYQYITDQLSQFKRLKVKTLLNR